MTKNQFMTVYDQEVGGVREWDGAVPYNKELGQYPYSGQAATVYFEDGRAEVKSVYDMANEVFGKTNNIELKKIMTSLAENLKYFGHHLEYK